MSDYTNNNTYRVIDETTWDRAFYHSVFKTFQNPLVTVTVPLDITHFYKAVKEKKISLTLALTYFSIKAANEVEAFRYRYMDGKVVLFDKLDTRFSYLGTESKHFRIFGAPLTDTVEEYIVAAKHSMETQKGVVPDGRSCDFIQTAPNPWFSYTSVAHTASGTEEDSIPLFGWGRFYQQDDRIMMPYTIKSHHSFVDARDHKDFWDKLTNYLNTF